MAKWGEGDPRWIVEERADATNVNNWHWTEKNATPWSKKRLEELLVGLKIEADGVKCEIKDISKIEGEATINNRKKKLIFFYEWELELEWKGSLGDSKTSFTGKAEIPNLSEENDMEDIDVNVSVKSNSDEAHKVKEVIRKKGSDVIRERLGQYIKDLKTEFSQNLILPSKDQKKSPTAAEKKPVVKKDISTLPVVSKAAPKEQMIGVKINTLTYKYQEDFLCPPDELYTTLTDVVRVQAWTHSPAEMETEKGGPFVLFNGMVEGIFDELSFPNKIVMRWRFKSWPPAHYSVVTVQLIDKHDHTVMRLTQTGIPDSDFDRTKAGWRQYYWVPIKDTFGFGARVGSL
ncbi:activator of 90 kDa heat shock protein ATPase homolog 1-like [Branchiostoma lanceolatum]|uniref:AHSA1 protein n=1 Tax=Branchiostoma lanceolatum TaxID=7740 RepID=A0A8K0ESQ3_BRALA|nr:AHSA1 [Branchiostoma lanceolatum]